MIRNHSAVPLVIEIPPEIHGHIGRQFQKSRMTCKVDPGSREPDSPSHMNHMLVTIYKLGLIRYSSHFLSCSFHFLSFSSHVLSFSYHFLSFSYHFVSFPVQLQLGITIPIQPAISPRRVL